MLTTGTNIKRARLQRFVRLRFFHAYAGEFGELRSVLRGESGGHVLHENDRGWKVAREARGQAHHRRGTARRRGQHDDRKTLIEA